MLFWLLRAILLSEKNRKKMESDSDYEEPSEDPFEGQFSDSDDSEGSDDSSEEIEIDNRDCLVKTY